MNIIFTVLYVLALAFAAEVFPESQRGNIDFAFVLLASLCYFVSTLLIAQQKAISASSLRKMKIIALLAVAVTVSVYGNALRNGGLLAVPVVFSSYLYFLTGATVAARTWKKLQWLFVSVIVAKGVVPVIVYLMFHPASMLGEFTGTFRGLHSNRNAFSYLAGVFIVWSLNQRKWIYFLLSAILLWGIIIAESRAVLIALFVVILVFAFVRRGNGMSRALSAAAAVAFVAGVIAVYIATSVRLENYGDVGRVFVIQEYIEFIKNNLMLGNGGDLFFEYYNPFIRDVESYNAHNFALHIISGYGLPVFIIYCWLIATHLRTQNLRQNLFWIYIYVIGLFQPTVLLGFSTLHVLVALFSVGVKVEGEVENEAVVQA